MCWDYYRTKKHDPFFKKKMYREVHHVILEESTDLCDRFDFVSKFIWIQNDFFTMHYLMPMKIEKTEMNKTSKCCWL